MTKISNLIELKNGTNKKVNIELFLGYGRLKCKHVLTSYFFSYFWIKIASRTFHRLASRFRRKCRDYFGKSRQNPQRIHRFSHMTQNWPMNANLRSHKPDRQPNSLCKTYMQRSYRDYNFFFTYLENELLPR